MSWRSSGGAVVARALGAFMALAGLAQGVRADGLALVAGGDVEIACATRAVVFATDAAKATQGNLTVRISGEAATPTRRGTWVVVEADGAHAGSLGLTRRELCQGGCPVLVTTSGEIQLWAPTLKPFDQLVADEVLLLAVLRPATSDLRATTFRGKQIEALEEGRCRRKDP